jgi:hypothetical protein
MRVTSSALAILALVATLAMARPVQAQVVSYSGNLEKFGSPVDNGFVIAGTFKPGFDVNNYNYVYGIDSFGNMETPKYAQAVSDGNFIPIGAGTLSSLGAFSGSGTGSVGSGHQVWLFAFPQANPDAGTEAVLATNPSWMTGAGVLTISGSDATTFKFGILSGNALQVLGLPVPEPSSIALAVSVFVATLHRRRRCSALGRFSGDCR